MRNLNFACALTRAQNYGPPCTKSWIRPWYRNTSERSTSFGNIILLQVYSWDFTSAQKITATVFFFIQGVCDSGQGFANGMIFCVCTKAVRERLLGVVRQCSCCCRQACYCGCACCHVCSRSTSQLATEYEPTTSTRESELLIKYNRIPLIESSTETSYATCIEARNSVNTSDDQLVTTKTSWCYI